MARKTYIQNGEKNVGGKRRSHVVNQPSIGKDFWCRTRSRTRSEASRGKKLMEGPGFRHWRLGTKDAGESCRIVLLLTECTRPEIRESSRGAMNEDHLGEKKFKHDT